MSGITRGRSDGRQLLRKKLFRNFRATRPDFDQVSYAFEKISVEVRGDSTPILSNWAVGHLEKAPEDFEKLLKERGLAVDSYDSIKYLYDEMEHPLTQLTRFVKREPSEILSNKSAVVFASALCSLFNELRHIAGEIDEEYSSEPDPVVQPEPQNVPITFTITGM